MPADLVSPQASLLGLQAVTYSLGPCIASSPSTHIPSASSSSCKDTSCLGLEQRPYSLIEPELPLPANTVTLGVRASASEFEDEAGVGGRNSVLYCLEAGSTVSIQIPLPRGSRQSIRGAGKPVVCVCQEGKEKQVRVRTDNLRSPCKERKFRQTCGCTVFPSPRVNDREG